MAASSYVHDDLVDELANLCQPVFENWLKPKRRPVLSTKLRSLVSQPTIRSQSASVYERDYSDELCDGPEGIWVGSREGEVRGYVALTETCREPFLSLLLQPLETESSSESVHLDNGVKA